MNFFRVFARVLPLLLPGLPVALIAAVDTGPLVIRELGHRAVPTSDGRGVLISHRLPGEAEQLVLQPLDGGVPVPVPAELAGLEFPAWSPDGRWLLHYVARGEFYALQAWAPATGRIVLLDAEAARPHRVVPALWHPEGHTVLYLQAQPPAPSTAASPAAAPAVPDAAPLPAWLAAPADAQLAVSVETAALEQPRLLRHGAQPARPPSRGVPEQIQRILALPTLAYRLRRVPLDAPAAAETIYDPGFACDHPLLSLSPDGRRLVTNGSPGADDARQLALLDLTGSAVPRLLPLPRSARPEAPSLAWRADGAAFAVVGRSFDMQTRRGTRELLRWTEGAAQLAIVASVGDPAGRSVAVKAIPRTLRAQRPDWGRRDLDPVAPVFAGGHLHWCRDGDVWMVPLAGGTPKALTAASELCFDEIVREPALDAETLLVSFVDPATWQSGVARVGLSDGSVAVLRQGEAMEALAARGRGEQPALFYRTTSEEPWDLFASPVGEPGAPLRRVTDLNATLRGRDLGRAVPLRWRDAAGEPTGGVLLVPHAAPPPGGFPVVLCAYPDDDPRLTAHTFAQQGGDARFNRVLVTAGYAVLLPRLAVTPPGDRQMVEIKEGALAALDAAVATGLIDHTRAGIYGYSWGGYMVHAVITQTGRFRAAAAGAGYADLLSNFVGAGEQSTVLLEGRNNSGVGGAPWNIPEVYRANSPLWLMDRVTTPLLLIHGAEDTRVVPEGSEQVFRALRHLKKPVAYLRYERGGHAIFEWSSEQQADLWRRLLAWFDAHLGAGAPQGGSVSDASVSAPDLRPTMPR